MMAQQTVGTAAEVFSAMMVRRRATLAPLAARAAATPPRRGWGAMLALGVAAAAAAAAGSPPLPPAFVPRTVCADKQAACFGNATTCCATSASGGPGGGASFGCCPHAAAVCCGDGTCALRGGSCSGVPANRTALAPSQCKWAHGATDPHGGAVASYTEYTTACGDDGPAALYGPRQSPDNLPAVAYLYALTRTERYAGQVHDALAAFAAPFLHNTTTSTVAFHCYETVEAYRAIVAAGRPPPWNASMQAAYETAIAVECHPMPVASCGAPGVWMGLCHGTAEGVWNHGLDSALQNKLAMTVLPGLNCSLSGTNCTFWNWSVERLWTNWLHGHALMENGDYYNTISVSRLLRLIDLMPGGTADLRANGKAFFEQYRDCIAPNGYFPNWGASFNDDASSVDEGGSGWPYVFERAAIIFQEPSFRWAARQLWKSYAPPMARNGSISARAGQWVAGTALLEKQGLLDNIGTPDFVDISGPMVAQRNNLLGELRPNKLVVAASRAPGSAYAQLELWDEIRLYHTSPMQTGSFLHYEVNETLFMFNPFVKHQPQSEQSSMLIMMPYTEQGDAMFPHRWGMSQYVIGEWQVENVPTKNFFMDSLDYQDFPVRTLRYLSFICNPICLQQPCPKAITVNSTSLGAVELFIDGVELVGPGGASRLIEKFDASSDVWSGTSFSTEQAPRGLSKGSMKVQCGATETKVVARPRNRAPLLDFRFNISEFTHMRYRWKVGSIQIDKRCGCATCAVNPRTKTLGCDQNGGMMDGLFDYLDIGVPLAVETAPPWAPYNWTAATDGGYSNSAMNHFFPDVVGTATAKQGGDSFGAFNVSGLPNTFTPEQAWHRQVLVLKEGPMVVIDRLKPDIEQDGWLAGPTWILGASTISQFNRNGAQVNVSATRSPGFDWVNGTGFPSTQFQADKFAPRPPGTLDMVLKMRADGGHSPSYGTTPGVSAQTCWPFGPNISDCPAPSNGYTTVFAKQRMVPGTPAVFTSVLLPFPKGDEASHVAAGITIGAAGRTVSMTLADVTIHIKVSSDDTWSVSRQLRDRVGLRAKSSSDPSSKVPAELTATSPRSIKTDDLVKSTDEDARASCTDDTDCSLNGACKASVCACDAPWSGVTCGVLDVKPAAPGGAYGYGEKFATTSWGGNVLQHGGKAHLYVTEIAGKRCGLDGWGNQSTVVHAVSDSIGGPYKKVKTVIQHEAHNPQALTFDDAFYVFHIGTGASTAPVRDCDNDSGAESVQPTIQAAPTGSSVHKALTPDGPFLPVKAVEVGSAAHHDGLLHCNNPSPFRHKNGTLFLACTWSIKRAERPEGPWTEVMKLTPPPDNARHWEDPFLFINERGFHILSHVYSMEAYPSNTISGHAFSVDGLAWQWSEVEPYGNAVARTDGSTEHFATLERPKLVWGDASNPTRPTHILNGVSPVWDENATDPCHECCAAPGGGSRCSCCKTFPGLDWTYTLLRPLKSDDIQRTSTKVDDLLTSSKIALYYSGWQLIAQRPDQPTPGDHTNLSRIQTLTNRGFTHVMLEDGNMLNASRTGITEAPRFLAERGLASFMEVGWSLHTFYMDPAEVPVAIRRQESPFVNYSKYSAKLLSVSNLMRSASPWLAGVSNDLEFPAFPSQHEDPASYFADLDERLGNLPSSTPMWPSFTDWPKPNAHPLPTGSNWTLEKLMYNMPRFTHNSIEGIRRPEERTAAAAVLRIAGSPERGVPSGGSAVSMVAQLFRPRSPLLARIDLWVRLTVSALPEMPYLSYYVAELREDGTPDTEHPVQCAMLRPKPFINPGAKGKWIKCGMHATELPPLVDSNATAPAPNSSAWQPIKLYFNPEEATLNTSRTYALVLQDCPLGECYLSSSYLSTASATTPTADYEIGSRTTSPGSLGAMVFKSGSWHTVPATAALAAFYTTSSVEHAGFRPNQLHEDWVAFHCATTAREIKEIAQIAQTIPALNSTNGKTLDVVAYSGYAGLGLSDPTSTTYFGSLRSKYGVDWEDLAAAGLTVAMVGYGTPRVEATRRLLVSGSSAAGRGTSAVPPLVCGSIGGTQAAFAERWHTCDGVMEYDGAKSFDAGLGLRVPNE